MQIRTKLTFYFVMITASLLLISFVLIFFLYKDTRSTKFSTSLKNRALTSVTLFVKLQKKDANLMKTIDDSDKDFYDFENVSIFNENAKILYTSSKFNVSNSHYYLSEILKKGNFLFEKNEFVILGFNYEIDNKNYLILAKAKDSYGLKNYENLKKILFFVFLLILSCLTLTGWIFTKRVMNPVSDIMNQVDAISPSNLNLRLEKLKSRDELSRLVNTFNQMLERIENAFKVQKTFTSNAAHELKNPLTIITSQLEVTLLKERSSDEYKQICESILDDVKRLNDVTHQMFLITKLSDKNVKQDLSKIRIDELIWETRTAFLSQYPNSSIEIYLKNLPLNDSSLYFMHNETLMKTCFWNLIENGIKFSNNRTISISLHFENNTLKIQFLNDGQKIDNQDIPFIFDPFYRSKNGLSIKGFGIGLSIVKQITEIYDIEINLVSRGDQKTQFDLIFPISEF